MVPLVYERIEIRQILSHHGVWILAIPTNPDQRLRHTAQFFAASFAGHETSKPLRLPFEVTTKKLKRSDGEKKKQPLLLAKS